MRHNNEKGYTMIETIMYISILGTLGVILASYAGNVITRYKTGRIAQQIIDLKKAIINYTAADEDYTQLSVAKMQEDKAIPLDMRDLRHEWFNITVPGKVSRKDQRCQDVYSD